MANLGAAMNGDLDIWQIGTVIAIGIALILASNLLISLAIKFVP
jgi:hypothetical protein